MYCSDIVSETVCAVCLCIETNGLNQSGRCTLSVLSLASPYTARLTSRYVPPRPAHTSPQPACPAQGLSGPGCGGPAGPRGCLQTRKPTCGGTAPSGGHPSPLQPPGSGSRPGPGAGAQEEAGFFLALGSQAERTQGWLPGAGLP